MKCDELKQVENPIKWGLYYDKSEVDAAIAELEQKLHDAEMRADLAECAETDRKIDYDKIKAENKRLKELKDKYSSCASKAIDNIAKCELKIRSLSRALFKACANWARSERYTEATWHGDEHREELWAEVQDKCLKKVEEYK